MPELAVASEVPASPGQQGYSGIWPRQSDSTSPSVASIPEAGAAPATGSLPPNALPGECYARAVFPPTYETKTRQVLVSAATEQVTVVPARYEEVEEKVVVTEASERLEVIPAVYEWKEEKVLVSDASTRIEVIPPTYKTVTEKILDEPEREIWQEGSGAITKRDEATGKVFHLITVPASYRTIEKRVLVEKGRVVETPIPAQYITIKKKVLKSPAVTKKVEIPAAYETVKVRKLVEPARTVVNPTPAKYETVDVRVQTRESRIDWVRVLCDTTMTPDLVRRIQFALEHAGYEPGPIDGILGGRTLKALGEYQKTNGLAYGGVTIESVYQLQVDWGQSILKANPRYKLMGAGGTSHEKANQAPVTPAPADDPVKVDTTKEVTN